MADLKISIDLDSSGVKTGAAAVRSEMRSLAAIDLTRLKAQLAAIGPQIKEIGNQLRGMGTALTAGLSLPLAGLATLGVKSALELDAVRTKITALVGDAENANAKIAELRDLAGKSVGVTQAAALETFAQLKGIGGIADESINKIIGSLGKLNAAFKVEDQAGFLRNLTQIFSQGFEIADIKEAIGRVPIFRQLLTQAFGTDDPEKLKQLKDAGKLTLDGFLTGVSDAINSDPRTANIGENLTTKLAKGMERLNVALAPIGQVILDVIVPIIEQATPYIEALAKWFSGLSKPVQTAIVAVAAFAAAIGPVLIIVGSLVAAIGTLIGSATGIGIAILAVMGIIVQLGPLLAVVSAEVYLLYKAWDTNFKGIRTLTVETIATVRAAIDAGLAAITAFWERHGTRIKEVARAAWNTVSSVVSAAMGVLGNVVRLGLQIVNRNWSGAWQTYLDIVREAGRLVGEIISGMHEVIRTILAAVLPVIVEYGSQFISAMAAWATRAVTRAALILATLPAQLIRLVPRLIAAGRSIASAIWEGIKAGLAAGAEAQAGGEIAFAGAQAGGSVLGALTAGIGNIAGDAAKAGQAAAKALTPIQELRRQLADAQAAYDLLANNGEAQRLTVETAKLQEQKGALEELLRLRDTANINRDRELPKTLAGINAEIEGIRKISQAAKDAKDAKERLREALAAKEASIISSGRDDRTRIDGEIAQLNQQIAFGRELTDVEKVMIQNRVELKLLQGQLADTGASDAQIMAVVQQMEEQQKLNLAKQTELQLAREIADAQRAGRGLIADLDGEIAGLNVQLGLSAELSRADAAAKFLQTEAGKKLDDATRALIIAKAQEIDRLRELAQAQAEARRQYDEVFNTVRDSLDVLANEGFGGFFKSVINKFQSFLRDMLAEWLTSQFFQLMNKGGGIGQGAGASGSGGGWMFGSILNGLFGKGSGGMGPGGTPMYNGNSSGGFSFGGGSGISAGDTRIYDLNGNVAGGSRGGGSGGGFLGSVGGLAGGLSLAGAGASMLGGMIGGRVGGFISNIGTGVALGAQIGSIIPGIGTVVGAVVGGAVGFFASLFGGDPKRKRDKKEKLPQLNRGFTDSLAELRQLIGDVRTLRVSPDSALAKATELRSQIASGFGIQFESKKYRNIAADLIRRRLSEADALIVELRQAAEVARAAGERERRILPEFAAGGFPRVGQVSLVGERGPELFVPNVSGRVISNDETQKILNGRGGGEPITVVLQVEHTIDSEGMVHTQVKNSSKVQREIKVVVQDQFRNSEIDTRRRGI
ncbi:MAG: hypothetical protein IT174_10820 [Acidobacteria bacterium]|nr:hypothetical protein [Acidobacteriota bacterium]